ncbi:MAG: carbon-nitrogen hydrolase family protein [Promethearchaeota archaeon]
MALEDSLTLLALQIQPSSNLTDTFLQIQTLLQQALSTQESVDCLVLPEYAFGTFREWATTKQDSAKLAKEIQSTISKLAKQYGLAIIAGSVPYQTETNQWRNRSFVFSATGKILGSYDKHHPFRAEKRLGLEPGTLIPSFKLQHFRVGVLICSDLWYHDVVSQLVSNVDFLAVPTMTTVLDREHIKYGQWAWHALVSVRAKEYTIPIISTDQASREYAPSVFTCGSSCIVDPSHRFTNTEGPYAQAMRVPPNEHSHYLISQISLKAIREYAKYRQDVGLRE